MPKKKSKKEKVKKEQAREFSKIDVENLLRTFGPDDYDDGTKRTPERFMEAFRFLTSGYNTPPQSVLKTFHDGSEEYDELVFQGAIPLYSLCEHHLLPFFGVAHIGYLPSNRIVGLSKISRLVDVYARRFQVQERLTTQIANTLQSELGCRGVGVTLRCRHMCMEMRGVCKMGTITYTSALTGAFKNAEELRSEFLRYVQLADEKISI